MTPPPPFARNDPRYGQMLNGIFARATAAHRAGQLDAAAALYREILSFEKRQFDAMHMLAVIAGQKGDLPEGVRLLTRAIRENPNSADAYLNLGRMQGELGDNDNAVRNLKKSIALAPNNHLAHSNLSAALRQIGASDEALAAADRAVALNGRDVSGWINRGNVLLERGSHDEARQCYLRAQSLSGGDPKIWIGLGTTNFYLMQHKEALAAYDEARKTIALTPDTAALRLMCKAQLCDWRDIERERGEIVAALRERTHALPPLATISIASSPADHLLSMKTHVESKYQKAPRAPRPRRAADERIGVAYLSGDFGVHPVGILAAGLFEQHDRSQFETFALSTGTDGGSALRQRIARAFDHFIDVEDMPAADIAELIRSHRIDILVDLAGFTRGARPDLLAMRPAPVQAAYLGFPGTTGASHVDYIIADATTIPQSDHAFYAEKVVTLPDSYMVNDNTRTCGEGGVTRADAGLPEQGFVFCGFNNAFKITPALFDTWMKILTRVPDSVLWLSTRHPVAQDNLRREARARGIDAERLIFAPQVEMDVHIARHRLAGLFLDTPGYNAHSTASDALWAGLPVLTLPGATFASRVAASLAKAAGTPETIVASLQDYEELAVTLAQDDAQLAALKHKLVAGRETCPLFDTKRSTRNIEAAYRVMIGRARNGEASAPFAVSGLD